MKRLVLCVLLSGCAATTQKLELDPEKTYLAVTGLQAALSQLVPSYNKLVTCMVEAKQFKEIKPCLEKQTTPPDPEAKK